VGLIPSSVKIKGVSEHNASRSFSAMEIPIIYRDISLPYYQVPILDDILLYFLKNQKKGYFLMPVMSLLGIHNLLKISDQNLFMIVSDKGFNTDHQLLTQNEPGLTLHGNAFSLNVDFRAIGKYFEIRGGDFFHQSSFLGLATNAYTLGYSLKQLPRTRKALETYLNVFSPGDLVNLNQHIFQTKLNCSLDTLVSYFNMTHWDPEVFNHHIDLIIGLITQSDPMKISDLINNLPKIVENFYYLPHGMDTLSNLGTVYQTLQDYPKAIEHYEQSIQFFGEKDYKVYNIGLCYYFLEKYDQAGKKFERTIQLNPEDIMAKGWLSQTKERLHSRSNYAE
jgi:tetratricopeptide (TPR) repeat protein